MESNKENENDFSILNVALRLPAKLRPVIESMWRITDRELDDLCALLIIDQLNYFRQAEGELLRYMKDCNTFSRNLAEGVDQYFNQHLK